MVTGNKQLMTWVADLLDGKKPELPRHYRNSRIKNFQKAIAEAEAVAEEQMPQRIKAQRRRKEPKFEARLDELIAKRDKVARDLDLDSSLIAPRAILEALAGKHEGAEDLLLNWQRNLLGL